MDINEICNGLLKNLSDKTQHLNGILSFTNLQTKAIEEQDYEKLNQYVEEKQKIIEKINTIDENFTKKMDSLKQMLGVKSLNEINVDSEPLKQIKGGVHTVLDLINQISLIEKENNVKVKSEFDDIKGKLNEISGGKKIISAYEGKNTVSSGGVFFDKKK